MCIVEHANHTHKRTFQNKRENKKVRTFTLFVLTLNIRSADYYNLFFLSIIINEDTIVEQVNAMITLFNIIKYYYSCFDAQIIFSVHLYEKKEKEKPKKNYKKYTFPILRTRWIMIISCDWDIMESNGNNARARRLTI